MPKDYTYTTAKPVKSGSTNLGHETFDWYPPTPEGLEEHLMVEGLAEFLREADDSELVIARVDGLVDCFARAFLTDKANKKRAAFVKLEAAAKKNQALVSHWSNFNDHAGYCFAMSSGNSTTLAKTYIAAHIVEAAVAAGKTAAFDPDVVAAAKKAWAEAYHPDK